MKFKRLLFALLLIAPPLAFVLWLVYQALNEFFEDDGSWDIFEQGGA